MQLKAKISVNVSLKNQENIVYLKNIMSRILA